MGRRLVAILMLVVLLAGCGGDDAVSTTATTIATTTSTPTATTTSTTAATTTTTSAATTTAVQTTTTSAALTSGLVWERVPDIGWELGGAGYQDIEEVAVGGPGLVAVGIDVSFADRDGAVWVSADGYSWARVFDEDALGGPGDQIMFSVAAGGPGLVAAGFDNSSGEADGAVWVSEDGTSWTLAADEALGGPGEQWIYSVTAGGPGLVAVGFDTSGGDSDAAVWVSGDGLAWTRIEDETVFGGPGNQSAQAVIAGGPGLVAVGGSASAGESDDAVVWASEDGFTWDRVSDAATFGGPGGQLLYSVTAGGPGLVAVGSETIDGEADGVVWVSADGLAWTRVDDPALGGAGEQDLEAVVAWGSGLVAVGDEWLGSSDESAGCRGDDGAAWFSADGFAWVRIEAGALGGSGCQGIYWLVSWDAGLVAVGADTRTSGDTDAAIWVSPPPSEGFTGDVCAVEGEGDFLIGMLEAIFDRLDEDPEAIEQAEPTVMDVFARVDRLAACMEGWTELSDVLAYLGGEVAVRSDVTGELAGWLTESLCSEHASGPLSPEADEACA